MKVTVQNGADHGLTRRDVETIIPMFPESWSRSVQQIGLFQGSEANVSAVFYPKAHMLAFFWPKDAGDISKDKGLEELLVALSVASERGDLPARLSKSLRQRHTSDIAEILQNCLRELERNAA